MSPGLRSPETRTARRLAAAHSYEVYGLRIDANRAISGLLPAQVSSQPDYEVILETAPSIDRDDYRLLGREQHDALVTLSQSKKTLSYLIEYADGSRFVIDQRERIIWCDWPPPFTTDDAVTYLVGPVLAFVLRLNGVLSLHASAVVVDGRAVLFLGPAGAGKSTLAAAMAERGHAILSDDVSAVIWRHGRPWILPGYPRLRLWTDVAGTIYGRGSELPPLTPNWDKRYVDLEQGNRFQTEEAVIGTIFHLQPRVEGEANLRRIEGHEAAMAVIGQTSMTTYLDSDMRARELAQVTRLLEYARVFSLSVPDRAESLDSVCAIIAGRARE